MRVVDLRSDTVTKPGPEMRARIAAAEVGDDVFGDDPTVRRLELRVAALLGKEDAVFVPSGTMANQLAIRSQTQPGDDVLLHERAHIHRYEGGGAALLSGVTTRTVDSMDGGLPPEALDGRYQDAASDCHLTQTTLVAMENTHNLCGGVVVPASNVEAVAAWARARGVRMHLDGARLWNAAVASGRSEAELASAFDTVSVCFSKGLGAPIGSALAGDERTIARARRFRKVFGGGMRQVGVIADAALYAVETHRARMADDHRRARAFAEAIAPLPGILVDLGMVQTNMVYFGAVPGAFTRPALPGETSLASRLEAHGVRIMGNALGARAVFHLDVDDEGLERAIAAMRIVTGAA